MTIPARTAQHGVFFVTSATFDRRRVFQVEASADMFLETLQHYRRQGQFLLHDFVVMPDHVHLLMTPQRITLEKAVGLVKGGFSRRMGSRLPVWQKGFTDHRIRDRADFDARRKYLRENPVRAGLVQFAGDYQWSSGSGKGGPWEV